MLVSWGDREGEPTSGKAATIGEGNPSAIPGADVPIVFGSRGQTGYHRTRTDRVAPDRTTGGRGIYAVLVI
jgi:hypothetical protein